MDDLHFYSVVFDVCSCVGDNGELTPIGERYREYYNLLKKGMRGADALDKMGIKRMCCRQRFLSIPLKPMIDRSRNRFVNDTIGYLLNDPSKKKNEVIVMHTPDYHIDTGLEFPILR